MKFAKILILTLFAACGFLVTAIIALIAWIAWDMIEFKSPNFAAASAQIEIETGIVLTAPEQLLHASRSASSLQGDHTACYIVALDNLAMTQLIERHRPTASPNLLTGCPEDLSVPRGDLPPFIFWSHTREDGGKTIEIYRSEGDTMVLIKMDYW